MTTTQDIVARLWNLCHVLRDDGITYHEYVTELTFLLFLKMSKETETEDQLPPGYRWDDLQRQEGVEQLAFYRALLVHLGNEGSGRVQAIFHDANTALRQPRNLTRLVDSIDALDWYSAREEGLGDLYEGLLEKNASEKKSGAGQYFTPRPLIECMVTCIQPQPGEIVQDPNDESAAALLERIREQRSQQAEATKARKKTAKTQPRNGMIKKSSGLASQQPKADAQAARGQPIDSEQLWLKY